MKEKERVARAGRLRNLVPEAELHVRRFSCIKDLTVKFKLLTVIIGEQASGKSITCKLYYYFTQGLRKVLLNSLRDGNDFSTFRKRYAKEFKIIFPETAWIHDSFRIEWSMGSYAFEIGHSKDNARLRIDLGNFEEAYALLLEGMSKKQKKSRRGVALDVADFEFRYRLDRWVDRCVAQLSLPFVDYVPAGRSFFSTIQDTVFTLLSNDIGIDYFLKEFGQKFESVRYRYARHFGRMAIADELRNKVLHGRYEYDGKEQWIVRDENHKVRLADASSGQQESLPLLLLLSNLFAFRSPGPGFVLIEEPEAHLYPTAQQAIVNYIGELLCRTSEGLGCIITTHSPFILCCLNNIIAKCGFLPADVSAYHLNGGGADDIFNGKLGVIDAVRFDDVSTQIANDIA